MRLPLVFGAMGLVLTACDAPSGDALDLREPREGTHQAIVGGAASDASRDATVLVSDRGRPVCSGVLIAPNLVLTARHCVVVYDERSECGTIIGPVSASRITVSVGAAAKAASAVARGVKIYAPDANELCSEDVALVSLDTDVKSIVPAKPSFGPPTTDLLGTAIGYGDHSRTQRADVKVLAVGPSRYTYRTRDGRSIAMDPLTNEIVTTESTCYGDSGGPLLDGEGRVVAIASRGVDEVCRDRAAFWTTLGGHETLIRDAAKAAGHPIIDTPPSGNGVAGKTPSPTASGEGGDGDPEADEDEREASQAKRSAIGSGGCAAAGTPRFSMTALGALVIGLVTLSLRTSRTSRARAARRSRAPASLS